MFSRESLETFIFHRYWEGPHPIYSVFLWNTFSRKKQTCMIPAVDGEIHPLRKAISYIGGNVALKWRELLLMVQKFGDHPWRLTWNIIMEVWKILFLSKWVICRFHVNLPGCNHLGCIIFVIGYLPYQLVSRISSINRMAITTCFFVKTFTATSPVICVKDLTTFSGWVSCKFPLDQCQKVKSSQGKA